MHETEHIHTFIDNRILSISLITPANHITYDIVFHTI